MYLATGDADAQDTYSIGIMKTTDGGTHWVPTTLVYALGTSKKIGRLLINPLQTSELLAGTSDGIMKTFDGGNTWTIVSGATDIKDMEYKPGDTNIVYAASSIFMRSDDGGNSFTRVVSGIATSSIIRIAIAVTPANPNYVYLLAGKDDNGFQGLYRSTDSGVNFTQRSNSPNIMDWSSSGGGSGGQAWYDLGFVASPTNPELIFAGGVNIWSSSTGGSSWNFNADWTGWSAPYVHADVHDLAFNPLRPNELFAGCDGGVFYTRNNGTSWLDKSHNLCLAEMYKMGSATNTEFPCISGHQDNGTNWYDGTNWSKAGGGDGMDCFIDYANDADYYYSIYNGAFYRNRSGVNSTITSGLSGTAGWLSPWMQDQQHPDELLAAYIQVFGSTDQGDNWSQLGRAGSVIPMKEIEQAPNNRNHLFATNGGGLFRSTDHGAHWTSLAGLPVVMAALKSIEVDPHNANHFWVSFSGYVDSLKVYTTVDGGRSWINFSTGLPNVPVNCLAYDKNSSGGIYAGTDIGVYYRDASMPMWMPYTNGMPSVIVTDLEINYPSHSIRAATYGRGMWQSPLATDSALIPFVDFSTNPLIVCVNDTVIFRDRSTSTLTSREWQFPDASPAVSTDVNPKVVFSTPGRKRVLFYGWNGSNIGHREMVIDVVENTNCVISATGAVLHSTFGSYYQWYRDSTLVGSTTGNTFRANTSGYYHVVVTNANGCISRSEDVYVDVSGITSMENGNACTLYPNPASQQIFLGIDGGFTGVYQYEIRNLLGQIVQKGNINLYASSTKYPISLNNLNKGNYLFSLLQESNHLFDQYFQVSP
jgi:photosystem II stability/assembly factor-like uncharacterized protein